MNFRLFPDEDRNAGFRSGSIAATQLPARDIKRDTPEHHTHARQSARGVY